MILMHLLTLSKESRHLFNLFTMLRWTTPQTDGCNNVTNDLHEVRPETADCNGCTTYGEQWRTGIFPFQDTPISIWDAGNLQAPRKKFQPQLEAKYKHVVLSETGVCPQIVLINGKMIINHWLDFEVPSFQTNHDKPMFENIFSLWMDSLATCFFSLGQGFNGCHTKRSKLIAVQSKEACASTATGVLEAHH